MPRQIRAGILAGKYCVTNYYSSYRGVVSRKFGRQLRCSKPHASFWPYQWPTSEKKGFTSVQLFEIFPKILRKQSLWTPLALKNLENAKAWECRMFSRRCQSLRTTVLGGQDVPSPTWIGIIFALLLLISQKSHDFWTNLCKQYLPCCPSLLVHTMQLIRDSQSCCSVQKTIATVAQVVSRRWRLEPILTAN